MVTILIIIMTIIIISILINNITVTTITITKLAADPGPKRESSSSMLVSQLCVRALVFQLCVRGRDFDCAAKLGPRFVDEPVPSL